MTSRQWYTGVACGLAVLVMALSDGRAAVYSYTDADGVLHVANVARDALSSRAMSVGSAPVPVPVPSARLQAGYDPIIREAAEYYSLPVALVKAVVAAESAFDPAAVSRADAHGLMQLRPRTAAAMSVQQIHDPRQNVFGGARYLRLLINQFNGNVQLALAAYNAGPAAVERAGGVPPFRETIHYVQRVLRFYLQYQ
ncbi:MAG: lytic transglycosylase domain-containing protein [Nitrospira sp.]|nr:lytic transglycosylase domain-containing protein [Nitrospira sp.]